MTKVECLKRLCESMTGHESDGETICEVLHDIGDNIGTDYRDGLIKTGETWLDGKPIYKFAVKTTLGELAGKINEHNPETIVNFYGQAVSTYGNRMPIPSAVALAGTYKMDFIQSNSDDHVEIQYGDYFHDEYDAYAIVEFTKKDDA